MYDYINLEHELSESEFIDFDKSSLMPIDMYQFGYKKYLLTYCQAIEIWYNEDLRHVKVKGSLPYFWKGHNYSQTKAEFVKAVLFISSKLKINLFKATVTFFEYGKTIPVRNAPRIIIGSHISVGLKKPFDYTDGKYFNTKYQTLKIYNAGKNYKNKLPVETRHTVMRDAGMNPDKEYIRVEIRFTKPEKKFNRRITASDLVSVEFNRICRRVLFREYKKVKIIPSLNMPNEKRHITAITIPLFALQQLIEVNNLPVNCKELIWGIINNAALLTKDDKKSRKKVINKALGRILTNVAPENDLSLTLIRKLASDRY